MSELPGFPVLRGYEGVKPVIGERVYIDPLATVIGRVTLGDDVSIWPMAVVRGDVNTITVGARTSVQDGTVLHVTADGPAHAGGHPLVIGEDVTIGHRAVLHGCTVGNRCLIGMGSIILDGAVVEDGVIIGAGALVAPRTRVESHSLWLGVPARRVRTLTDAELQSLQQSASHYVRVKDRYRNSAR